MSVKERLLGGISERVEGIRERYWWVKSLEIG
jgi:hypothetical protein